MRRIVAAHFALLATGCVADDELVSAADELAPVNQPPNAERNAQNPVLVAVDPPAAGASVGATVTIEGEHLIPIESVVVGDVLATAEWIDTTTIEATFAPVAWNAAGARDVTVNFVNGKSLVLEHGFTYTFDEDPIVLAHGCPIPPDTNEDVAAGWDPFIAAFVAAGYPESHLHVITAGDGVSDDVDKDDCPSNIAYAEQLAEFVDEVRAEHGVDRIDLVGHSMGALATRWYIAQLGGDAYVREYVTLAGASHGTFVATPGHASPWPEGYIGAKEMSPPYACGAASHNAVQDALNGCLTAVGRLTEVDETPADDEIAYLSLWHEDDEIIQPATASCLDQSQQDDCSSAINEMFDFAKPSATALIHSEMRRQPVVLERVLTHVLERNAND